MEKNDLYIRIYGKRNGKEISPETFDISDLRRILEIAEIMMPRENDKANTVTYSMEKGSVINHFKGASAGAIALALSGVISTGSINASTDERLANGIEALQNFSKANNFNLDISSELNTNEVLQITPETNFKKEERRIYDTGLILYGTIVDAGGSKNPNIHLKTNEYGVVKIKVDKDYLAQIKDNILYKVYGIKVKAKKYYPSFEFVSGSIELVDMFDFSIETRKKNFEKLSNYITDNKIFEDAEDYLNKIRERGVYAE